MGEMGKPRAKLITKHPFFLFGSDDDTSHVALTTILLPVQPLHCVNDVCQSCQNLLSVFVNVMNLLTVAFFWKEADAPTDWLLSEACRRRCGKMNRSYRLPNVGLHAFRVRLWAHPGASP